MAKTRVLVVEDSLTVRKYLAGVIEADPDLQVAGEAEDGKQGIEVCMRERPDVVVMDMMMPVLSGLSATEFIMAYCPTPILVCSSSINRGEVFKTYDALSAGAVDVLEKPRADRFDESWEREFRARIKLVSKIKVITHPRARLATVRAAVPALPPAPREFACVAMGASTGGPAAVLALLRDMPADYPLPIFLVIHIGEPFGLALCEWLDGLSPIRVVTASHGQRVPLPGQEPMVFMAPHGHHMIVRNGRLWHSDEPERHSCRPAVDVLFESVAREYGASAIGCLLTGMGRDGAAGMQAIQRAGGLTLAQDEASSVVFGMPREAIQIGAASRVLSLDDFAPTLRELARTAPATR